MKGDEAGIRDLIRLLWREKWWLAFTTLVIMVITMLVSLSMPKVYRATAVLIPPEVDQAWPTIDGLKTRFGAASVGASMKPSTTATDVIIGILKSRRIALALIDNFNLRKVYAEEPSLIRLPRLSLGEGEDGTKLTELLKKVAERSEIRATKEGLLSINIEDQDPKRAAEMVQFCLDELGRVNIEMQTTYNQYLARVLDPPIVPDKKTKPRVGINTLLGGMGAVFLWSLVAIIRLSLADPRPRVPVDSKQDAPPDRQPKAQA